MAPKNETAKLNYLQWQEIYERETPYQIFIQLSKEHEHLPTTNLVFEEGPTEVIRDVRGSEASYSLDEQGFTFRKHITHVESWLDEATIKSQYYSEVEEIIKKEVEGADKVVLFDYQLRKSEGIPPGTIINYNDKSVSLTPSNHVHVDQSESAVLHRIRMHTGKEADFLTQGRTRIINVWRPYGSPVEDHPIALCDGSTLRSEDLVETDHVKRGYEGSTYYLKYSNSYSWHFLRNQRKDEVVLIKMFDSAKDVKARRCPHTSFKQHDVRPDAPPRESIEVRALVFTFPQNIPSKHE